MNLISNKKIIEYYNNALKFFGMIRYNSEINPNKRLVNIDINTYNRNGNNIFASYTPNGVITIYLQNISDVAEYKTKLYNEYTFDDIFYSILYISIVHELYHSSQIIDIYKYSREFIYSSQNIEEPVISLTYIFMEKHKDSIQQMFNFKYNSEVIYTQQRFINNINLASKYSQCTLDYNLFQSIIFYCNIINDNHKKQIFNTILNDNLHLLISLPEEPINGYIVKQNGIYLDTINLATYLIFYKLINEYNKIECTYTTIGNIGSITIIFKEPILIKFINIVNKEKS